MRGWRLGWPRELVRWIGLARGCRYARDVEGRCFSTVDFEPLVVWKPVLCTGSKTIQTEASS